MADSAIGELLIFFLLILNSGRIFFVKRVKIDTLVILAPVCVLLAFLQIFAWGLNFFAAVLLVLSLTALIINLRALFRFAAHLYVDHYNPLFVIFSMLIIFTSLFCGGVLIKYCPVAVKAKNFNVSETKIRLSGSFASGFVPAGYTAKTAAYMYIYEPVPLKEAEKASDNAEKEQISVQNTDNSTVSADAASNVQVQTESVPAVASTELPPVEKKPVILFVSDKRADTENYRPYLMLLAQKGYTVCSIDFYAADGRWFYSPADWRILRRFAMITHFFQNKADFDSQKDFYTFHALQESRAAVDIAEKWFGTDVSCFMVGDGMTADAVRDTAKQMPDRVSGSFVLNSIKEYKTPGFGCTEQTNPLVAHYYNCVRDKTFFIPRYLALKTDQEVQK